jgi:5-deoxy-glucuronate isomerase
VYSPERGLDELIRARDGDLVLIPYGYHPVVAPPGYDVYYFNALAGSAHAMTAADEPRYAWVRGSLPAPDPRVPLVK